MAKKKGKRSGKGPGPKRSHERVARMSVGCLVLAVVIVAFLVLPKLIGGLE